MGPWPTLWRSRPADGPGSSLRGRELRAHLLRHEAGCQRIYLQLLDLADTDHLRLVAQEVCPQLAPPE